MKILMLKTLPASLDGMSTRVFEADEVIEIDEGQPRAVDLADALTRGGFAELVTDEQAASHLKALEQATPEELEERKAAHKAAAAAELEREAERLKKPRNRSKAAAPPPPLPPPPAPTPPAPTPDGE